MRDEDRNACITECSEKTSLGMLAYLGQLWVAVTSEEFWHIFQELKCALRIYREVCILPQVPTPAFPLCLPEKDLASYTVQ